MNQTVKSYHDIVAPIKFRDWRVKVEATKDPTGQETRFCYLVVEFDAPCASTRGPAVVVHRGRKWLLSPHMTEGEVVQTALMAVLAALEHEAREDFTYKNQAIFGPHYDLEILVAVCETGHGDIHREVQARFDQLDAGGVPDGGWKKGQDHDGLLDDVEPTDPFRRER